MSNPEPAAASVPPSPVPNHIPRIKGTTILMQKGNVPTRVVTASGTQFAPNDVEGVQAHLASLASDAPPNGGQHVKIKGTHIMIQKGGEAVRIATVSGRQFAPNDVAGVQAELQKIANGESVPLPEQEAAAIGEQQKKSKSKKKKSSSAEGKKELSTEEMEARKEKNLQRFQAKVATEERHIVSESIHTGEVVSRGSFSAVWIRPLVPGDIPGEVQVKLEDMNSELRERAKEHKRKFAGGTEHNVIFADLHDVKEEGLLLKTGIQVRFKLYTDNKGVGCCEITAAP